MVRLLQQHRQQAYHLYASVSGLAAGVTGSPIQYDSTTYTMGGQAGSVGGWYLSVSSTNNEIYTTLSTNAQYNTVNFTPSTFIKRIPDPRDLQDRTYRVRYVIDKDKSNPLPRTYLWFRTTTSE